MGKDKIEYLDFEIDKLTRSIENAVSGDSFSTEVSILTKNDLKKVLKKYSWQFDREREFNRNEGFVSFHSITALIGHYEKTLGAYHMGGQLMIINTEGAKKLIDKYFKS